MAAIRMHELGLARAASRAGDLEKAGALFEQVVGARPDCDEAWFGLGDIAFQIGDIESALVLLQHAVALKPKSAEYRKRLGESLCRSGQVDEGVLELKEAQGLAPADIDVACALSGAYVAAGRWNEARKILVKVCARKEAQAGHFCLRGMTYLHQGQLDEAVSDFKKAARMTPEYPAAWHSLGDVYRMRGELEKAADCIAQALRLAPREFGILVTAGHIEAARGNSRSAANLFQQANQIKGDSPEVWASLGIALVLCGDSLPAIDALERAHQLGVSEDWVYEHMGLLFTTRGQLDAARENLEMAVEREAGNLNAWNTLIVVYTKLGLPEKARQAAETVLSIDPEHINALLNLGSWYSDQARNEEALSLYRKALGINPKSATAYINTLWVMVHSSEVAARDVLAVAREFERNLCKPHRRTNRFGLKDHSPGRMLRVGWLTSDLRTHPVAAFVLPFLNKFDSTQVENTVYYNSPSRDEITNRSQAVVQRWRDVLPLGDDELADLIESDDIDILIDLNGNTEGNRLLAVARKPAPVVVTWLGFPGTSGMAAVDYIIVPPDPVLEAGAWCSETPWPLPDCYGVRTGIPDVPIMPGLPCERSGEPFTFGCLNNFRKVSQQAIRLWSEILRRVPDSRLVVVARGGTDGMLVGYIHEQFGRYGIPSERLVIHGIQPQLAYFNAYNQIDLGLDPFPFNGGTSGYDSIWMGVPYVTWPGDMLVSRMGKPILHNVGLDELVVDSAESYVEKAVALANDRDHLRRLRSNLRERMQQSPLADPVRLARGLEVAFREMWQRWCSSPSAEQ